ncbi:MAG: methyltransferase domain-containing protein [Microbacteriaceae bacterium]|nr:methyltransferase domain-containing protein [Microbacteriaceae bacterium]
MRHLTRSFTHRSTDLRELMDDPNCDPVMLRRTLRRFALVNRLVAGWGRTYRTHLRPALSALQSTSHPTRILDIGTGGGDVLRHVVRLASRDGFSVQGIGIDPDERAISAALSREPQNVTFRLADTRTLLNRGEQYDIVISNHLLHHLPDFSVIDESRQLASHLIVHSDIARSQAAYLSYAVGITPFAPGSFLRTDGLRSIRRSFTADELRAALCHDTRADRHVQRPPVWRVEQPTALRLLAVSTGFGGAIRSGHDSSTPRSSSRHR